MPINQYDKEFIAIINCQSDNQQSYDFYTLGLWGKLCFEYVCDVVCAITLFSEIYLLTKSSKIAKLAKKYPVKVVSERPVLTTNTIWVSGTAIFLTEKSIINAICDFQDGVLLSVNQQYINSFDIGLGVFVRNKFPFVSNAFVLIGTSPYAQTSYYVLSDEEALTIDSIDKFELALVLKKKKIGRRLLTKSILERIKEKENIFLQCDDSDTICLVGHSQIDLWGCDKIGGYNIRNCGIRGISSVEYEKYILKPDLLNCNSDIFIVMHGINDIVCPYSDEFIIESISHIFDFIEWKNPKAKIYFIKIVNTNGRLERPNKRIDGLNNKIDQVFSRRVSLIDTKEFSDEFGDLKMRYTIDGLHFSQEGYETLLKIVEQSLKQ